MKAKITILSLLIATSVSFWGCISTPFEVAGDVLGASFDAAGAVAEVPFAVAEAAVEIPFDIVDASWEGNSTHKRHYSEKEYWTFDGGRVEHVVVVSRNGSIVVNATGGNQIYVEAQTNIYSRKKETADKYLELISTDIDLNDETLNIRVRRPHQYKNTHAAVHYTVYTPANVNLVLTTTNGRIVSHDIHGTIKAKSTNGHITSTRPNGHIQARTTNGRVELKELNGDFNVVTTNGHIYIDANHVGYESYAETTNARIDVEIEEGNPPVKLITTNGHVKLTLPETYNGNLDARTSNSSVSSELPVTIYESKKNQLKGTLGSGGDAKVYIRSTNGRIRIEKHKPMYATATR